jgi:hypothetical protein
MRTKGYLLIILKKAIIKEDGRALIYYHFPKTASASQKQAFEGVAGTVIEIEIDAGSGDPSSQVETDGAVV